MRGDVVKRLLHQWAEENCSDSGVSKNRKRVVKRVMDRLDRFADEGDIRKSTSIFPGSAAKIWRRRRSP